MVVRTMTDETVDSLGAKPVYRAVRTSRLYELIVQQVEESILKGQLKPGDQLPAERDLAQRFGVSRTAVREAVKTLREKGLVEAYSGRGTFVTDGTSHAIRQSLDLLIRINRQEGWTHLAELRYILEPEIAALATPRIEEQLLTTMREARYPNESPHPAAARQNTPETTGRVFIILLDRLYQDKAIKSVKLIH